MALKLIIEIIDTDREHISDVIDLIADQIKKGFNDGFNERIKKVADENNILCKYRYKINNLS